MDIIPLVIGESVLAVSDSHILRTNLYRQTYKFAWLSVTASPGPNPGRRLCQILKLLNGQLGGGPTPERPRLRRAARSLEYIEE